MTKTGGEREAIAKNDFSLPGAIDDPDSPRGRLLL